MTGPLLTRNDLCEHLRISGRTLSRLIHRGLVPALYVGGCPRWRLVDVEVVLKKLSAPRRRAAQTRDEGGRFKAIG